MKKQIHHLFFVKVLILCLFSNFGNFHSALAQFSTLKDINQKGLSSDAKNFSYVDNKLFFEAVDSIGKAIFEYDVSLKKLSKLPSIQGQILKGYYLINHKPFVHYFIKNTGANSFWKWENDTLIQSSFEISTQNILTDSLGAYFFGFFGNLAHLDTNDIYSSILNEGNYDKQLKFKPVKNNENLIFSRLKTDTLIISKLNTESKILSNLALVDSVIYFSETYKERPFFIKNDTIFLFLNRRISNPYFSELQLCKIAPNGIFENLKSLKIYDGFTNKIDAKDFYLLDESKFLFTVDNKELWVSDGSNSGTFMLALFEEMELSDFKFGKVGSGVVFSANNRLWTTDGTIQNTRVLGNLGNQLQKASDFKVINSQIYFLANINEIWTSLGDSISTFKIADLPYDSTSIVIPFPNKSYLEFDQKIVFNRFTFQDGFEPWIFDFSINELYQLADVNNISESAKVNEMVFQWQDKTFFMAKDHRGSELWQTDGTKIGTNLFYEFRQGFEGFVVSSIFETDSFFICKGVFDGDDSTSLLALNLRDMSHTLISRSLASSNYPIYVTALNENLYFSNFENNALASYRYNLRTNQKYTFGSVGPSIPIVYNEQLIFIKNNRLYRIDKFAQVSILNNTFSSSKTLEHVFSYGDSLLFIWRLNSGGRQLVHYDISAQSVKILTDFQVSTSVFNLPLGYIGSLYFDKLFYFKNFNFGNSSQLNSAVDFWYYDLVDNTHNFLATLFFDSFQPLEIKASSMGNKVFFNFSKFEGQNVPQYVFNNVSKTLQNHYNTYYTSFLNSIADYDNWRYDFYNLGNFFSDELWKTNINTGDRYLVYSRKNKLNYISGPIFSTPNGLIAWGKTDSVGIELQIYKEENCEGGRNYTLKSGSWHDADTWSCGHVPLFHEFVIINSGHKINCDPNLEVNARKINTMPGAVLELKFETSRGLIKPIADFPRIWD